MPRLSANCFDSSSRGLWREIQRVSRNTRLGRRFWTVVPASTPRLTRLCAYRRGGYVQNWKPDIPRIWEGGAPADWATPVAGLNVRPAHISAKEHYSLAIDILRTYPVYFPGREPEGYSTTGTRQASAYPAIRLPLCLWSGSRGGEYPPAHLLLAGSRGGGFLLPGFASSDPTYTPRSSSSEATRR